MNGYLRRLATTGAAYTASSVLSKLFAVALLPIYTRHVATSDFGAAENLSLAVIAAAIVFRLGLIEALLRFYYKAGEDPERVVKTAFAALLAVSIAGVAIAMPFADQISQVLLDRSEPGLTRIAIGGLGVFILYELMLTLYRLDERPGPYFFWTIGNVLLTIPVTVWLVVFEDKGATGLLIGQFGVGAVILVGLLIEQRRRLALVPDRGVLRRMLRFGAPTMPAELSLYSLSFIDRILIAHIAGLAEAGVYAIAVKFAQTVQIVVRGFQLAYPPLAYSIADDDEARKVYALVLSWFLAVCSFIVVGTWLFSRQIVDLFAAPAYFQAHEVVGLVATGVMLYALYFVLVVVIGRTGRTEYSFPATVAGTIVNIALNLILIPPLGIVGAGLALVASYLVLLGAMYFFSQRLFPVPYEWGRIAQVAIAAIVVTTAGELLLPTEGIEAWLTRGAAWACFPLLLWITRFPDDDERDAIRGMLKPGKIAELLREARAKPAVPKAEVPAEIEQEMRDEDRL